MAKSEPRQSLDGFRPQGLSDEDWETIKQDALIDARRKIVEQVSKQILAAASFTPPPEDTSESGASLLSDDEEELPFLVEKVVRVGQNVSVTGQYKVGKSMFLWGLIHALTHTLKFLGSMVVDDYRKVGLWSLEMDRTLTQLYVRPMGFDEESVDLIRIWHGQGYGVNLLGQQGKAWAIKWLKRRHIEVWVIDSWARICQAAAVDEKDNFGVGQLLKALDEIKVAAGVESIFIIAHTGRAEGAQERARGATAFDDWADARWVLTREGSMRFFMVEGRRVELEPTSLVYDQGTGLSSLGVQGKTKAKLDALTAEIVRRVNADPGKYSGRALIKTLLETDKYGADRAKIQDAVSDAVHVHFIAQRGRGPKTRLWPADEPSEIDWSTVKRHQDEQR